MIALLTLLLAPAHAGDGYWHPTDLMSESAAFQRLNEGMLGPYEERERLSSEYAQALNDYQLALDLLGDRAPSEAQAHLDGLRKQFNRDQAVIRAFAGAVVEDVDTTFYGAVERALAGIEGEVVECESQVATGPQVPGMKRRTQANPDCKGTNHNKTIAAALDADAALKADVDEILALTWPDFDLELAPQPAIGGDGQWIEIRPLFRKGAGNALKAIDMADETARLPFQAAIEEGADKEQLAKLAEKAQAVTAATAAKRAALAAPVLEAADKSLAKAGVAAGWCPVPARLGGCDGTDLSKEWVGKLLDDSRVEKSLKKAAAAVGG